MSAPIPLPPVISGTAAEAGAAAMLATAAHDPGATALAGHSLWGAVADHLILETRRVRHGVADGPRELRVAVPAFVDAPLYRRATRRFDFTLGERDIGPVTLPLLLEHYLADGGRVELLTTWPEAGPATVSQRHAEQTISRIAANRTRFACRTVEQLDTALVLAPTFALLASGGLFTRGEQAGDAGILTTVPQLQREIARAFDVLWRSAMPWNSPLPRRPERDVADAG